MANAALSPVLEPIAPPGVARHRNANAAGRARSIEAELRRHLVLTAETALVHGPYRQIGLRAAEILPFNT